MRKIFRIIFGLIFIAAGLVVAGFCIWALTFGQPWPVIAGLVTVIALGITILGLGLALLNGWSVKRILEIFFVAAPF